MDNEQSAGSSGQLSIGELLVALLPWFFAALLAIECFLSLSWRMEHDSPLLHYAAFLVDRFGLAPYRDVFETSMPGTLLFHLAIGKTLGYGDLAFRLVDVSLLGVLLTATYLAMRDFGGRVALTAAGLFGCFYLGTGQPGSLQRDYLGAVCMSVALAVAVRSRRASGGVSLAIGALSGIAASIKPQLAIGLPILWFYVAGADTSRGERIRSLASALAGFAVPPAICLAWLSAHGALPAFLEMVTDYLPLHLSLSGTHETIAPQERLRYLLAGYVTFGEKFVWIAPAIAGGLWARRTRPDLLPRIRLLFALFLAYSLLPPLAGQFWQYHWMPCFYFTILLSALCLLAPDKAVLRAFHPVILLCLVASADLSLPPDFAAQIRGNPPHAPEGGRADAIARYIESSTDPNETVQVLDWTGGGVHALLLSERRIATPFLYDYHFYHHVSDPAIRRMRERFMTALRSERPRLIVEVLEGQAAVSGPDTASTFPELRSFLRDSYAIAQSGDGYIIYRRL